MIGQMMIWRKVNVPAYIICPCAAASSVITAKLGGSMEQMTAYTFISNFVTAILFPRWVRAAMCSGRT